MKESRMMKFSNKGFTLIELIVTLILAGIIIAAVGIGIAHVTQGFLFTKENAATLQKGQMAVSRISLELKRASIISDASTATSITFDSYKNADGQTPTLETRVIRLNGDNVEIVDGSGTSHILTDRAAAGDGLTFRYYVHHNDPEASQSLPKSAKIIVITLRLAAADGVVKTFTDRVRPRNLQ